MGIVFRSDAVDWDDMALAIVSDASHANEETAQGGPFRSQGGRSHALASMEAVVGEECRIHLIGHASTILRRVCISTFQAEAYSL